MTPEANTARWELIDFEQIPGVPCPCGAARRALTDAADLPFTLHRTQIEADARTHYHRRLTETYVVLECGPEARMELDGENVALRPGLAVVIRPGVRHRAVGQMTVLIFVTPKFDPADEWFDSARIARQRRPRRAARRKPAGRFS